MIRVQCIIGVNTGRRLHKCDYSDSFPVFTFLFCWQDYMGRCILTLTRVLMEGEYKETFELDGAKSGKLNLHLKWAPQLQGLLMIKKFRNVFCCCKTCTQ